MITKAELQKDYTRAIETLATTRATLREANDTNAELLRRLTEFEGRVKSQTDTINYIAAKRDSADERAERLTGELDDAKDAIQEAKAAAATEIAFYRELLLTQAGHKRTQHELPTVNQIAPAAG